MAKNGNGVFTIDGVDLRLWVASLKRKFEVLDTQNSGRVQSFRMYRDIGGTFYNYTMEVMPDKNFREDYDTFYEIVSSPVESHILTFPYAQDTLTFDAYVTNGEDNLKIRQEGGKQVNKWDGLSLNFISMEPQRRP